MWCKMEKMEWDVRQEKAQQRQRDSVLIIFLPFSSPLSLWSFPFFRSLLAKGLGTSASGVEL